MDKAVASKVVDPATRKDFALNDLVLIVPAGSKKPADLADLKNFKRIAVGNPDSVPAGRYTREALTNAKLWDVLQPQVIQGASVRQVLDYVARGEVDAGFVYGTDAKQQAGKVDVSWWCRATSLCFIPSPWPLRARIPRWDRPSWTSCSRRKGRRCWPSTASPSLNAFGPFDRRRRYTRCLGHGREEPTPRAKIYVPCRRSKILKCRGISRRVIRLFFFAADRVTRSYGF